MVQRISLRHRGFQIIAAEVTGKPMAQVFLGKTPANPQRFGGATLEAAVDLAREWIDAKRKSEVDKRRAPYAGTVEEYIRYLEGHGLTEKISPKQRKALVAHAASPLRILSATQIAEQAGWPDFNTTNLQYGRLGKSIADELELELPIHDGVPTATYALADAADPTWKPKDGHFRWQMHEELAEALTRAHW
jgi:hypothetical protein